TWGEGDESRTAFRFEEEWERPFAVSASGTSVPLTPDQNRGRSSGTFELMAVQKPNGRILISASATIVAATTDRKGAVLDDGHIVPVNRVLDGHIFTMNRVFETEENQSALLLMKSESDSQKVGNGSIQSTTTEQGANSDVDVSPAQRTSKMEVADNAIVIIPNQDVRRREFVLLITAEIPGEKDD
ncbi:MAG: hypothetical protein KC964_00350, partial [Candidatus Omnitrophica bacterium]|nr:hypothetical protein [Candidatus Omnitrophota bacterium]